MSEEEFSSEVENESVEAEAEGLPLEEPGETEESGSGEPPEAEGPEVQIKNLHAALKEERHKRQADAERAKRLEDTFQRVLEMQSRAAPPKAEEPAEKLPDPEEDLGGYLYSKIAKLEEQLKQHGQLTQQEEQSRQQYLQQQAMMNEYRAQAGHFMKQEPNFLPAYNALLQDRIEELETMGFRANDAAQMAQNEEMMIVQQALNEGVNPAERIFQVAKRRGLVGNKAPGAKNGDQVLKAATRANTMTGTRGAARGSMTLEQLAQLDGEEFEKAWNKMMR